MDRIAELEDLAQKVRSLSSHLDTARYTRDAYMALYDVRAVLKRLGFTDYGNKEPQPE